SPKPVVKIQPATHVFMNERVTFRCEFQTEEDSVWIYDWYRDDNMLTLYHTYYPDHPHYSPPTTQEFSISFITDAYKGKYTCRGRRHNNNQISKTSDPVTLTVSERFKKWNLWCKNKSRSTEDFISTEKPTLTVSVNPQSSIYTGDTVTLNCNLQSTGLTFLWYKYDHNLYPLSPKALNTNTFIVKDSNEGRTTYYCKALRGNYESEFSAAATVTVK
ncbi:Fc receptor-like protein 5, partial [Silurus asotus]